jgi:general secretion pathway protein L
MALAGAAAEAGEDGFLAWWLEELRTLLPARRPRRRSAGRGPVLFYRDGVVRVLEARRGGVTETGSFLLERPRPGGDRLPARLDRPAPAALIDRLRRQRRLVLRFAPEHGLVGRDLLPAGAEAQLHDIVGHRLDALTPWTPEQAWFDVEVTARRPDGRIEVAVAALRRDLVQRVREGLAELGLEIGRVDLGDPDGPLRARFDLGDGDRAERGSMLRLVAAGTLGALLLGGLALAGSEIHARSVVLTDRTRAAAALEERLSDLPALRERLETLRSEAGLVAGRLRSTPSALAVLEELSRLLPDDVYLSELALERDRLQIGGFAASASPLVPLLEALPSLEDVRFDAPSSKAVLAGADGERRELERFALAARVVGRRGVMP